MTEPVHGELIPYLVDKSKWIVHNIFMINEACRPTIDRNAILRLGPDADLSQYDLCDECFS